MLYSNVESKLVNKLNFQSRIDDWTRTICYSIKILYFIFQLDKLFGFFIPTSGKIFSRSLRQGCISTNLSLIRVVTRHMTGRTMMTLLRMIVSPIMTSFLFVAVVMCDTHRVVIDVKWCHHLAEIKIKKLGKFLINVF